MTDTDTRDLVHEARLLRKLVDNAPALLAYWDRDLRNLGANAAYREWFGFTPEQMRGIHIREVLGEEVYAKNLPFIEAALRGEEQHFDRTLVDPEGRVRHSQADYIPEVVDGDVVGFYVMVVDTTAKVEAQRQLDEAQSLAHLGSWSYYPATGDLAWSAEMFRLLGFDPEEHQPSVELWRSRFHPEDRDRVVAVQSAAWKTGEPYELHYRLLLPDVGIRHVASRARPDNGSADGPLRMVGTLLDETDIRMAADELVRSNDRISATNELLSDTVAMLGHDVRQPIQAVSGFLEFTQDAWDQLSEEQRRDNVARALGSSRRLSSLVDNILALMSVEAGGLEVRPAEICLLEEISQAAQTAPGIEVRCDGDPALVAWADPFHLRQVLANLLTNSAKYGAPPFEMTVTGDGDRAVIEIADHGEGVPAEFVPHLFDRFSRAATGVAAAKAGSGFGLYLARSLVEANGGSLTYLPNAPRGARFRITLPTAPA